MIDYAALGYDMPAPKFATLRDPSRPTRGIRQAQFSDIWLRSPLMPAQRYILDTAGEVDDDGEPLRKLVVVTMQRRGGKSHVAMARSGERCLSRRNYRSFYTAQTGGDAQDQFLKFNDEVVKGSPLEKLVVVRRGNGKADMTFPNGSTRRPMPPGEGTGHGKESDEYDIDEAWWFDEEQGKAILQAVGPTQMTRRGSQIWIWSAGGTAASTWLAALVARGRAGDPTMAYFEWGIPDDMPLTDLAGIARHHPAFGHTINEASIVDLRTLIPDDAEFARAAGNRWTEVIGGALDWRTWQRRRWDLDVPDDAPVGYGAARAADGQHVVIAAAAQVDDLVVVEVVDVVPVFGAAEVVEHWAGREGLVVDPEGPSSSLHDALKKKRVQLLDFPSRSAGAACANVLDALESGAYRYRQHQVLDDAVKVAGTRRVGDGGVRWARLAAGAPIASLEAATNAIWALEHRPRQLGKPVIRFGGAAA